MSITEAELAAAGVAHLKALGYSVSEEVMLESALRGHTDVGSGRADLVAQKGSVTGVLEAKLSLSWALYAQAKRWREYAHVVWMLVAHAREDDGRLLAFEVARRFGFGVWELGEHGIVERVEPLVRDAIDPELVQSLRPEHQDGRFARAGSKGGEATLVTGLSRTLEALRVFVADNQGCSLAEAVPHIKHHFWNPAQAMARLEKMIQQEKVQGVFFGWKDTLWPTRELARGAGNQRRGA